MGKVGFGINIPDPQNGQRESLVLYNLFNTLCLFDALSETDLDEGAVLAGGALEGLVLYKFIQYSLPL